MTHVPYKGMAPAVTDLIAGHADVLFASAPSIYQHVKAGKVRGLGVTTEKALGRRARPAVPRSNRA
jgi:tripartite-type tricarboxylate transporter receptor subunit TctC